MLGAAEDALRDAGIAASDLAAVGITNQRETTIVWDRRSGRPVHRAIVWQDRRTAERCQELPADLVRDRTGLVPDPYFSATKLEWILSERDASGLAFGTVDSWLVWKLTGGRSARHRRLQRRRARCSSTFATSPGTPSCWSSSACPRPCSREVVPSSGIVGEAELLGARVPDCGPRGRPAGSALRPGLLPAGAGEGHVRHGELRARERRRRSPASRATGLVQTVAWRLGDEHRRVRARGLGLRRRAPRSSGSATASACSRTRPRARRSHARWTGTTASTSSRH